jgi:thiopeptide-type bacteriocin biosynthesis protein
LIVSTFAANFNKMHTWLSYHVYPQETQNVFLVRALQPFLAQNIWPERGARAFFVRFADEKGEHVRVRLRGERTWLQEKLMPAWEGAMEGRGELIVVPYRPETERFGGEALLPWAEEHFHISTRVTLDLLSQDLYSYGDAMHDNLKQLLIMAFCAGLSPEKTAWYFGQLQKQWLDLYFREEDGSPLLPKSQQDLNERFKTAYQPQKKAIQASLSDLWENLQDDKFATAQPQWLRWFRGNQMVLPEFGADLDRVMPSLLHLSANRLGILNPDEVFAAYILSNIR